MHSDPLISTFVALIFAILISGYIMRRLHQPYVVSYIITGMIMGPHILGYLHYDHSLLRLGNLGVILLLFFVGMEVSPRNLMKHWIIAIIGTLLQICITIGILAILGLYFGWGYKKIVFFGFVISLSSTAVIFKLLEEWGELTSPIGQGVIGILLMQDLLIIPMLIILDLFAGGTPSMNVISLQVLGAIIASFIVYQLLVKEHIKIPFVSKLDNDHETQVFLSFILCFGMAIISNMMHLSAALGAFLAGMVVGSAKETNWVHHNLLALRTIFVALFFTSIGMLIDINFILHNFKLIMVLVILTFSSNTIINMATLIACGQSLGNSIYGGLLLSQIGEFSFVIATVGYTSHIININTYQVLVTVIAMCLLLSPIWISVFKRISNRN